MVSSSVLRSRPPAIRIYPRDLPCWASAADCTEKATAKAHAIGIATFPIRDRLIGVRFARVFDLSPFEFSPSVKMLVKVTFHDAMARTGAVTGIMADRNFSPVAPLSALINAHDPTAMSVVGRDVDVSNADTPATVVQRPDA
jgi:hypothetical protein